MATSFFGNHLRVRYTFIITHAVLLLFILLFCVLTTYDVIMFIFHCASIAMVLIYLIPAAVLCWRNRESGYERGWVEMLYITYQVLWSWVCLIWLGLLRDPGICASAMRDGPNNSGWRLWLYSPWALAPGTWRYDYDAYRLCQMLAVVIAFSALHALVLLLWFGWTLWLTTKVAKTMGDPWTRDKVLKRVSMGKMAKLHLWREGEDIGLGKINSQT